MVAALLGLALIGLGQPDAGEAARAPEAWTQYYLDAAKEYKVTHSGDGKGVPLDEHAIFDWSSIEDYNGALFAWTDSGRPALVATIFSFPVRDSKQRTVVHEFAAFSEVELAVAADGKATWQPPPFPAMKPVPGAAAPPESANVLKLQCRRLAKDFSANFNRRGERWDLRLLPTPLLEWRAAPGGVLGGGLFAFVGYSTDPEILLLIEARKEGAGPAAWYYQPVRFSDKSLFLSHQDKPVWESWRTGHGSQGPDTDDPLYRVLASERISPELIEQLGPAKKAE
jgi:hypothetical protein